MASATVGAALGGLEELVGQALRDGLDVPDGGLAGAGVQQPDGLFDTARGRDVDGRCQGARKPGGVLARARDRIH